MIDTDIEMIDIARDFGAKVYFGDGTRLDVLRQAGAAEAELILFCLDGDQLDAHLIEAVHEAFPRAALYVRAFDRRAVIKLKGSPASYIVREVLESAIKMARLALRGLEVGEEQIDRAEDMYRARDKERLKLQIEAGDIRVARDRIITEAEPKPQ
jgi:CPA2 family monovalent cation:H+ antiporter-2/glutathione-regulated potassium-efflux system protein KefB